MTRGIYKITLGIDSKVYIGQSLNIEERTSQHKSLLKRGKHYNFKLQNDYNITGTFVYEIVEICSVTDSLYDREKFYMSLYSCLESGYSIAAAGISGSGINHPSNVYSKEQILEVVDLCLDPKNQYKHISEITGVSISTIRHLADRSVHYWLEELIPDKCIELVRIRDNRLRNSFLRSTKQYQYTSLISPEGIVYSITNISAFGRKHGLDSNKLGEIMRGTRNTHKNWRGYDGRQ